MIDDPYTDFQREDMILRDWLALDRTVLANKRTFLAYGRTAIALMALGIAFVKLIDHPFFELAGFSLMAIGVVVFFIGAREFADNSHRFKRLVEKERAFEARMHEHEAAGHDA
jgi:putative membrane protein